MTCCEAASSRLSGRFLANDTGRAVSPALRAAALPVSCLKRCLNLRADAGLGWRDSDRINYTPAANGECFIRRRRGAALVRDGVVERTPSPPTEKLAESLGARRSATGTDTYSMADARQQSLSPSRSRSLSTRRSPSGAVKRNTGRLPPPSICCSLPWAGLRRGPRVRREWSGRWRQATVSIRSGPTGRSRRRYWFPCARPRLNGG